MKARPFNCEKVPSRLRKPQAPAHSRFTQSCDGSHSYEYTQRMLRVSLRAVSSNSAVAPGVAPFVASVVLTFTQQVNGTTVKAIEDTRNETDAGGELRNSHKEKYESAANPCIDV